MVRAQVVGGSTGRLLGAGKSLTIISHQVSWSMGNSPCHKPVRHRRLDFLSAGRPLDGVAGAQVDDAAFPGFVIRQLQFAAHVFGQQTQHRRLRRRRHRRELIEKDR